MQGCYFCVLPSTQELRNFNTFHMKSRILFTFSFCLFAFGVLHAQTGQDLHPCGTQDGISAWLREFQENIGSYQRSDDLLLAPITVHIVGEDGGSGYFPVQSVMDAFCTLNQDFLLSGIQFYIAGDLNYINNSDYYDHNWQQGLEMMEQNNVPNTINCYIVDSPAGNCGYSRYWVGIALAKGCLSPNSHTWAHEVGHTLSLPHPFFGWEGYDHDYNLPAPIVVNGDEVEKTDGSNCGYTADGFCDTPPDYLNFRWPCGDDNFSTQVQLDPDSVAFVSDGSLIMSYSFDNCASRFSDEQTEAMQANLIYVRPELLGQQDEQFAVDTSFLNAVAPLPGDTVNLYEEVYFEWEPVPNATRYMLEIATFPDFPFVLFRYLVEGNSTTIYDLFRNKNYYWRLRPFNSQYTCIDNVSETSYFRTGEDVLVGTVQALQEITSLKLHPNPVASGKAAFVSFVAVEALSLDVSLTSLTGRAIRHFEWQTNVGPNQFSFGTDGIGAGVYTLQLRSGKGMVSRKVVVGF